MVSLICPYMWKMESSRCCFIRWRVKIGLNEGERHGCIELGNDLDSNYAAGRNPLLFLQEKIQRSAGLVDAVLAGTDERTAGFSLFEKTAASFIVLFAIGGAVALRFGLA